MRDVGWAPSIGLPTSTIASCSQVRITGLKTGVAQSGRCSSQCEFIHAYQQVEPERTSSSVCLFRVTAATNPRLLCHVSLSSSCRTVACSSGRATTRQGTPGRPNCCTSSTTWSGTSAGLSLETYWPFLEETTRSRRVSLCCFIAECFSLRGTLSVFLAVSELADTSSVCGSSAGDAVEGVDGRSVGVYQ